MAKAFKTLDGVDIPGLQILINGSEFFHFTDLNIARSVDQFVDTFSVSISNPKGRYSTTIPVGALFQVFSQGIEIFRGLVERKTTQYGSVGSTMTLTGREELVILTETDVDPTLGPFRDITDNEIIALVIGDSAPSWDLQLGEGFNIKEYSVAAGSVRKGQVIEDVVKFNDFYFFKEGLKLRKEKIPRFASGSTKKFRMTVEGGQFHILNSRILTVVISEDITNTRSEVSGFSYQSGKAKRESKETKINQDLVSGNYASRIRNRLKLSGYSIKRKRNVMTPAKDIEELQAQMDRAIFDSDIDCEIELTMYGIFDIGLLDVIDVQIEQEGIVQYMYVSGIVYELDSSNKLITKVTSRPFPRNFDAA